MIRPGIGVVALVIAAAMIGGLWYVYMWKTQPSYTDTRTSYSVLIKENLAFAEGETLMRARKPDLAVPRFRDALSYAKDSTQEIRIMFRLAVAIEHSETFEGRLKAIPVYKEIGANPAYTNIAQAYAIQQLANMFYIYGDNEITEAVFKDEPYKQFFVAGDVSLSYRNLYEYSSSLYPLAISELRIAGWYAGEVLRLHTASSANMNAATREQIARYKETVRTRIASADRDILRIQTNPNDNTPMTAILMRKGVIIGNLQLTGDTSFGDMEPFFQRVLSLHALSGDQWADGYTRYYYALYLSRLYGNERVDDVRKILSNFYQNDAYRNSQVEIFFKNERRNTLGVQKQLGTLASIDPKFKEYLSSLGWELADFMNRQ